MPQDDGFRFASRTQSAETIKKLMEDDGMVVENIEVFSSQPKPAETPEPATPAAEAAPPAEPAAAEPVSPESSPASEQPGAPSAGEPEADDPNAQPAGEQHRQPRGGFRKKIAKLESELDAERTKNAREIEELKRQLAERSAAPAPAPQPAAPAAPAAETPAPATPKPVGKPKPTLDDFADAEDPYLALVEATSRWAVEDERAKAAPPASATPATPSAPVVDDAAQKEAADAWAGQITAAKAELPDFEAALNKDHGKPVWNPVMGDAARMFPHGAKLVYYLATHPDEAHRIEQLTEIKQGDSAATIQLKFALACAELGSIKLEAAPLAQAAGQTPAAPQSQPQAQAPQAQPPAAPAAEPPKKFVPPTPIGTRGAPGHRTLDQMTKKEIEAMPLEEFRRRRAQGEGR